MGEPTTTGIACVSPWSVCPDPLRGRSGRRVRGRCLRRQCATHADGRRDADPDRGRNRDATSDLTRRRPQRSRLDAERNGHGLAICLAIRVRLGGAFTEPVAYRLRQADFPPAVCTGWPAFQAYSWTRPQDEFRVYCGRMGKGWSWLRRLRAATDRTVVQAHLQRPGRRHGRHFRGCILSHESGRLLAKQDHSRDG